MDIRRTVNSAAKYAGKSQADLARALHQRPQVLNGKLEARERGMELIDEIGKELGARAELSYIFEDGKRIS